MALPPAPTSGQEWTKWAFPQRLLLFPQPHLRDWPRPTQPRRPRRVPPCVPGCLLRPWVPTQEARQPFARSQRSATRSGHQVGSLGNPKLLPGEAGCPMQEGRLGVLRGTSGMTAVSLCWACLTVSENMNFPQRLAAATEKLVLSGIKGTLNKVGAIYTKLCKCCWSLHLCLAWWCPGRRLCRGVP